MNGHIAVTHRVLLAGELEMINNELQLMLDSFPQMPDHARCCINKARSQVADAMAYADDDYRDI